MAGRPQGASDTLLQIGFLAFVLKLVVFALGWLLGLVVAERADFADLTLHEPFGLFLIEVRFVHNGLLLHDELHCVLGNDAQL